MRRALARPDTIVVHEPYWTPMARHADIVVPSTTSLERNDLACTRNDPFAGRDARGGAPVRRCRDDYDTFAALAHRLGFGERFTEGRTAQQWIEHLYEQWRGFVLTDPAHVEAPAFDEFWRRGFVRMRTEDGLSLFSDFRDDPERNPLTTPSGRIEIFSADIDGFGYDDCAGHPRWFEPDEWLGGPRAPAFPLHLIANQPRTRLHGQLDHGGTSQASKIRGREPIRLHPADAADRGLAAGEVVRVFNDRGACLAGVVLDDGVRRGGCSCPPAPGTTAGSVRSELDVRARQPQRPHRRRGQLAPGPRVYRAARARRGWSVSTARFRRSRHSNHHSDLFYLN